MWSGRYFFLLFLSISGLKASIIQNPVTPYVGKDSSSYLRVTFNKTTDPIMEITEPQRLALCPTGSSYKFSLNWKSLTLIRTYPWLPKPHYHNTPQNLYSRKNGTDGLKYTPLPPVPLLQMNLYANEANGRKILCKATNEQMVCGNLQSSALHRLIYALPTPALYSKQI